MTTAPKTTANQSAYLAKLLRADGAFVPAVGRMRAALRKAGLIRYGAPRPNGTLPEELTDAGRAVAEAHVARVDRGREA